jgi:hypothetical protein
LKLRNQDYSPRVAQKAEKEIELKLKIGNPMKYDAYAKAPVNFSPIKIKEPEEVKKVYEDIQTREQRS